MDKSADYPRLLELAHALLLKCDWTEMTLASCPLSKLLALQERAVPQQVEDETYLKNAVQDLKLAKAFDRMDCASFAFKHALKALRTMEALVQIRKPEYSSVLAPFYFRCGDYMATYIELNTDEFGNVKPLPADLDSEDESQDEPEEDPREEEKDEPAECQIDTVQAVVQEADEGEEKEENGEELVESALHYLALALQIVRDLTQGDHSQGHFLYLEIDTRLRMAELGKHVGDYEAATQDFTSVVALCK